MSGRTWVRVGGPAPYDVVVGRDLLEGLGDLLPAAAEQVALVHPVALAHVAGQVSALLEAGGRTVLHLEVPEGEAAKQPSVLANLWSRLAAARFTRTDAVVGLGGGATTDLAGFLAATWLRGVPVVHVPTTVLGMVDAAIGGKTAIDLPEGKNLVGAFHPPAAVLCDLDLLAGLPPAEVASGLAEVVKAGFIADPAILELIEQEPDRATDVASAELRHLVERAIRVKADVVSADLRESGQREMLNYGHTLGHAIEQVEGYTWRHGAAISVGMVFAAALAHHAGRLDRPTADRHRVVLELLGLPTRYQQDRWPELLSAMAVDKKARGATLRFVVLDGLGRPSILAGPDPALLEAAYAEVCG